MKYIQVIDGAVNCAYDIFAASDEDHALLFPNRTDIAFADDFAACSDDSPITSALTRLWDNRVPKTQAMGIHATIFYDLPDKRQYYPTLRDEDAINPDGTRLRKMELTR
ncbi:MAG TPA: hypothetical protein VIV60_14845 [Polyangiaceae bacterium]